MRSLSLTCGSVPEEIMPAGADHGLAIPAGRKGISLPGRESRATEVAGAG